MADLKKIEALEKCLWSAADSLRANTGLTTQEYSRPILGLTFLKYAEFRFTKAKEKTEAKVSSRRRVAFDIDSIELKIKAEGAMYVPHEALNSNLLALPDSDKTCLNVNNAFVAQTIQNSQGSKMPRANWEVLKEFRISIPNEELLRKYNRIVDSAIEQIRVLSLKNGNLKKQRDILLPRLVSGEIEL